MWRKNVSTFLYLVSFIISIGGTGFMILTSWKWLMAGKGIGSFGILFIFEYVIVGTFLWILSGLLHRRKKLDMFYCLLTAIPIIMLIVFPVEF